MDKTTLRPNTCEFSCTQNGVTNMMCGWEDRKEEQTREAEGGGAREEREEEKKKKLKIGNPHLGMVAKEADGIV